MSFGFYSTKRQIINVLFSLAQFSASRINSITINYLTFLLSALEILSFAQTKSGRNRATSVSLKKKICGLLFPIPVFKKVNSYIV
jgi:hypothetical protein